MTKLYDGIRELSITMRENGNLDFSREFFAVGSLSYDDARDAYIVDDVDYCIDMASDWADCVGDYHDDIDYVKDNHVERVVAYTRSMSVSRTMLY